MSANTVAEYVRELEDKRLVCAEQTMIRSRDGRLLNGTLLYHIRPIQGAVDCYHDRQMWALEESAERQRVQARLSRLCRPQEPPPTDSQPATPSVPHSPVSAPCAASTNSAELVPVEIIAG